MLQHTAAVLIQRQLTDTRFQARKQNQALRQRAVIQQLLRQVVAERLHAQFVKVLGQLCKNQLQRRLAAVGQL